MTPGILLISAAFLGFTAAVLRPDANRACWAGCAAALLALGMGLGLWWQTAPVGELSAVVSAPGLHPDGEPATSRVTLENEAGMRRTHHVTLVRPVPAGAVGLGALIALGLLGLFISVRGRQAGGAARSGQGVAIGGVLGLAGVLGVFYAAQKTVGGEAGVRAFLDTFDVGQLQFFSVPADPWTYTTGAQLPLILACAAAAVAVIGSLAAAPERVSRWGLTAGAVAAAVACVWQIQAVGGVPWRPLEGGLWATSLLLGLAALGWRSPARTTVLSTLAVVVAALTPLG